MDLNDIESAGRQTKCIKCGSTDIFLNIHDGMLRCNYCRYEFEPERTTDSASDLNRLEGTKTSAGLEDIPAVLSELITIRCISCAAEVVVNTAESVQARCHWCRNTLSISQRIPNGAVPDLILPFSVNREEAKALAEKFIRKRWFYIYPKFKKEFTSRNMTGVYLLDKYDADLYNIEREAEILIEGLTLEARIDKRDKTDKKTNNIIHSILPFDTENCVAWHPSYLNGYTSEKRDSNVAHVKGFLDEEVHDIVRYKINETLKKYDRGVCWAEQKVVIKGENWKSAYLPVWLYSYQKKSDSTLHYIAVNGRTKETMGSIPIHATKLVVVSIIVEILVLYLCYNIFRRRDCDGEEYVMLMFMITVSYTHLKLPTILLV